MPYTPTYSYDAENRMTTTAGVTYTYDGDGNRVKKSSGTLYWGGGSGSGAVAESDLSGTSTTWKEYVFFNGKRIARRDASTTYVYYYFSDHLGSTSLVTDAAGTMSACPTNSSLITGDNESDYCPYGGEISLCNRAPQNYKFTGKERDSESGLDEFGARYYSSAWGRFMIPDWAAKPATVPYANFGNPQSLNLYSYVQNNPTTVGDLDGHCYPLCTVFIGAAVGAATGAGAEYLSEKLSGKATDWTRVKNAAKGGALTGALTGLAGPEAGLAAKLTISVAASITGGAGERLENGAKVADLKAIGTDAAAGLISVGLEKGLEKLIPKPSVLVQVSKSGGTTTYGVKPEATVAEQAATRTAVRKTFAATVAAAADTTKRTQEQRGTPCQAGGTGQCK